MDLSTPESVRHWAKKLGTTDEALIGASQAVGTDVARIKEYLGAGGMAGDQEAA